MVGKGDDDGGWWVSEMVVVMGKGDDGGGHGVTAGVRVVT